MRKAGRQKESIWAEFEEIQTSQKTGKRVKCKACGLEMQGLVQRMKNHKASKCKRPSPTEDESRENDDELIQLECQEAAAANVSTLSTSDNEPSTSFTQTSLTDISFGDMEVIEHTVSLTTSTPNPKDQETPWTLSKKRQLSRTPSPASKSTTKSSCSEPVVTTFATKEGKQLPVPSMQSFTIKTTLKDKEQFDYLTARFIYATNLPFKTVEHPTFLEMIRAIRPGYKPPNRKEIAEKLLDKVFDAEIENSINMLRDQVVCMSIDGWSNVMNDPVICATVAVQNSSSGGVNIFLVSTIDTSGHPHTSEYLFDVAKESIKKAEEKFLCTVGSLVTDNAPNIKKMRTKLMKDRKAIITYGCSAHLMNLLAKDLEISNIKEHIVQIIKYFRNNHCASSAYKAAGGRALVMPQDVRWNTLCDCLESYLTNWPVLITVCDGEKRNDLDKEVIRKVMDTNLKRNSEDMLKITKTIAVALDRLQSDLCNIGDATEIWKVVQDSLMTQFKGDNEVKKKINKRISEALTQVHYLAYMLHPSYQGEKLSEHEESEALEWANEAHSNAMPDIMRYRARTPPFLPYLFKEETLKVGPYVWWLSLRRSISDSMKELATSLFTTTASSSGVERVFSSFGLVQSKLRNRLGTDKAAKLVFIYKSLNSEY